MYALYCRAVHSTLMIYVKRTALKVAVHDHKIILLQSYALSEGGTLCVLVCM